VPQPAAGSSGRQPDSFSQEAEAGPSSGPQTAEGWVDALVQEMAAAKDIADAKGRATKVLHSFEHFVSDRVKVRSPWQHADVAEIKNGVQSFRSWPCHVASMHEAVHQSISGHSLLTQQAKVYEAENISVTATPSSKLHEFLIEQSAETLLACCRHPHDRMRALQHHLDHLCKHLHCMRLHGLLVCMSFKQHLIVKVHVSTCPGMGRSV
jgi:hypothetical protein